jgi:colanic acid biosynthesis glycosyl transferase WcaI
MSKKFLLISQVFYPDQVSTANLFTDMCSVLAGDSIDVEVWSAQPSYTENRRQPPEMKYKGIFIQYLPSTNFRKNSISGRIFNILTFTLSAGFRLLFSGDKTPVWTHTTPPFTGIIISFICSVKKRKLVYILLDIFPEGLIRVGKVKAINPLIKLWHNLFIKALKRSEKIIVIGRDIKSWVENVCPECTTRIEYIPHWQDDRLIFPIDYKTNEFVKNLALENKFVVQYSGNMGLWNEVRTMGKAVKQNLEDVVFMFVGGGLRKKELFEEFVIENQPNVVAMPFQPNEKFNSSLNAAKVHLVTLGIGLEGMAVPCKIYGILASGIPVIAMVPASSEVSYVVKEENCGIVLNPGDLAGLIETILLFKSNENLRKQMGMNGRLAFEKKYTTRIIADTYKALLNEIS